MRRPRDDFDSAYKEIGDHYPARLFELFFPDVYPLIDWERGWDLLEQEIRYAVRVAGRKKRTVDKLYSVWLKDGSEAWVLLHVEFQAQVDETLPERVFICNPLLFARHRKPVASFVILGDPRADWRPEGFGYNPFGRGIYLQFHVAKLLDWKERMAELEASSNPFALIIMAHLASLRTRRHPRNRLEWKKRLTLWLLERGAPEAMVVDLFRFLDLIMALPPDLAMEFDESVEEYQRRSTMPVLSQTYQIARQQGERDGAIEEARESVLTVLDARFPEAPEDLLDRVRAVGDLATLRQLLRTASTAPSLESVESVLP